MAGCSRYLWTDGGVEAWGLMARACGRVSVRCLSCSYVPYGCRAWWMVLGGGGGSRVGLYVAGWVFKFGRTGV